MMSNFKTWLLFLMIICASLPGLSASPSSDSAWWKNLEKEAVQEGYQLVTINAVMQLIEHKEDVLIIDVRPDYEYQVGHLPDAINFEFDLSDRWNSNNVKKQHFKALLEKNKHRQIIIYCRSAS